MEAVPSVENASKPPDRPPGRLPVVVVCLFLALAVFVVFGQTLRHDFVNYDDDVYVYENPAVTTGLSPGGIAGAFARAHGGNWHPLTTISHMADCQLYGLNPGGHHMTNVLLHTATVLLLFLLLRNLTGAFWPSVFVAAVFGLHPLRVESVAWVSERKDVLSGLFFVLTLGAYLRYARRLEPKTYWFALGLFALGLLSKSMVVTLPFVLLLLDYWPLGRWRWGAQAVAGSQQPGVHRERNPAPFRRLIVEKVPFLLLSAAAAVTTILVQQGTIQSFQSLSFLTRIGNAAVAGAVYLRQMLYPSGLAVFYPHQKHQLFVGTVGLSLAVLIIISAGVLRWQRKRPYLLVGWLWYLGMLVPVIGLLQVGGQAHADRYTYLPQIGLSVGVVWGLVDLCAVWRCRHAVLRIGAALVLMVLTFVAHLQTSYWRDSISLWTHTLACTSPNYRAHNNLGVALAAQGKFEEAIQSYERALAIKPALAETHANLGIRLAELGQWAAAVPHFQQALKLAVAQANPALAEAIRARLNSYQSRSPQTNTP